MTAFMKKSKLGFSFFPQILACTFGHKYLAARAQFEISSCQMFAKM